MAKVMEAKMDIVWLAQTTLILQVGNQVVPYGRPNTASLKETKVYPTTSSKKLPLAPGIATRSKGHCY